MTDGVTPGAGVEPARDYDQMVNWGKRLAREGPFFRDLFERVGVSRLVDAGCGSGQHAVLFSTWGIEVAGIDPSPPMLAQARENALRAGVDLALIDGGFGEVADRAGTGFDAVVTLGNGLPHVAGEDGLRVALVDFAAALRPAGVLVLHLLNHERLINGRVRMMPPVFRETPDGDRVFLKVLDYVEDGILFDFVTLTREPGAGPSAGNAFAEDDPAETGWHLRSRRSVHTALPVSLLEPALERVGFADIEFLGDHSGRVLDVEADESVIVVARRAY
ncbi:MAG: class I SAM-dependent methyltransferase [Clostridiales bacterium]|nr:class I SAM-dependent methyltransferase [Clostridiales bacterium]